MRWRLLMAVVVGLGAGVHTARAIPPRLPETVPAGTLVVLMEDRHSAERDAGARTILDQFVSGLFERAQATGAFHALGNAPGALTDVLAELPRLARCPHAIFLTDVQARPLAGGGARLAKLQGGLILLTGGDNQWVRERIQFYLDTYTNRGVAHLAEERIHGARVFTLRDQRLPPWAVIQWGAVRDAYLVTVGTGAFERARSALQSRDQSLADDAWFTQAHARSAGPKARWECLVDLSGLRDRLSSSMGQRLDDTLNALGLKQASRGLWTVRRNGRWIEADSVIRSSGQDRYVPITLSATERHAWARFVPPAAQTAMIFHASPRTAVPQLVRAYLTAQRTSVRERLRSFGRDLETTAGVQWQADVLDKLGDDVVVHDWPRSPLRLPLFVSVLVPIKEASANVHAALDRLMTALQERLAQRSYGHGWVTLERAEDGVWYLQWGLCGPALGVAPGWIVISHSPTAVRANLAYLQQVRVTSTAPAGVNP